MHDDVTALLSTPLRALTAEQRDPDRARLLAPARSMHEQGPDTYWEWVAQQQDWMSPWTSVRTGDIEAFEYFVGATMNVSENCVGRWARSSTTADKPAIVWEGDPGDVRTITYSQLESEVDRLAGGLHALGATTGDVIAIYMPNLIEAVVAIHACNRIGAIYTILFSGFGVDAVRARLTASRATMAIVADVSYRRGKRIPLLETLRAARMDAPHLAHTIVVDRSGDGSALAGGETYYTDVQSMAVGSTPPVPMDANAPSFLIFTSGTEGSPKGVVHSVAGFLLGTWANVLWQVGPVADDVYWVAADVGWLTFPIQAAIGGLAHGMTVLCFEGAVDHPTPHRFFEICERHGATKVLAAPTVLRMLRRAGDDVAGAHPLPALELVTVQGEPLDAETFEWTSTHIGEGVAVVNAYGQTETGSTWSLPVTGVESVKPGSVGTAVPGHRFDVVDDNGKSVAPGTTGLLVLTAPFPTLARTVWGDHDRYLSSYFARFPGVYCTHDDAVLDHDGHLWVLGRHDDVINVAAHRISTLEIESVATALPSVAEAAVVGIPDPTKGSVPIAFLTLVDGADREKADLAFHDDVADQIGTYATPTAVYFTDAMPKTRTGKIMRRVLRDIVEHGSPRGDISAMEDVSALESVIAAIEGGVTPSRRAGRVGR